MKRIIYALGLIGLSACNNTNSNTTQATNSSELPGLQTTAKATTEQQTGLLTNPEHGKPGHDCALPVGAPLAQKKNLQPAVTAPSAPPATVVAPQPQPQVQVQVETPNPKSGQKVNPPHGQPGHDCAVAVGAPLTQKSNVQKVVAPTTTITSTPPVAAPKPSNGQKINPPHGQPGHDCAVAVGAPLS